MSIQVEQTNVQGEAHACTGESAAFRLLLQKAAAAASLADKPILVTGEVGVGKSSLARYLHFNSVRRSGPLQFVECGSFGDLDNVLFGHRAGSFTGAVKNFPGRIRQAEGGTLVLDDFDRLSHHHQDQLHRVIVDGEFYALGADRPCRVDVRVIATTNRDVQREIEAGRLKPDFVSRLDYFTLHVPSLRERPEDIPVLCQELMQRNLEELVRKCLRRPGPVAFHEDCWPALQARVIPDNVRGLDKLIVRLIAHLGERTLVTPEDLDTVCPVFPPERGLWFERPASLRLVREAAERDYILQVCQRTRYNLRQTARILSISPKSLYVKLHRYGIARP